MKLFSHTQILEWKGKGAGFVLTALFLFSLSSILFSGKVFGSEGRVYTERPSWRNHTFKPCFLNLVKRTDISSYFSRSGEIQLGYREFDEDMATHTLSDDQLTYTFTLKNKLFGMMERKCRRTTSFYLCNGHSIT